MSAQILTLLGVLLGIAGVSAPVTGEVKVIAAAAIPLLIAAYQWQVHRTKRNATNKAAVVALAKVQTNTATAVLAARVAGVEARQTRLEAAQAPPLEGTAPSAAQTPPPEQPASTTGAINGGTG